MSKNVLTHHLSEPLCEAKTAKIDIDIADGNLMIGKLTGAEQLLASGTLQYLEKQGLPAQSVETVDGRANLTLKAVSSKKPWLHLPWESCNGATEWKVDLNPTVSLDISAHSGGGNVKLDLAGLIITHLEADTGGGNMDVFLPGSQADLSVTVKSGAGNVIVHLPGSPAARIQAASGLGKVIVDSRFQKIDRNTYQSRDYDGAANKVEIMLNSGAGNVIVSAE